MSPDYDHILNEDITAAILEDTGEEVCISPSHKLSMLTLIFKILPDVWFNECVQRYLKRNAFRPFIKDSENESSDPQTIDLYLC